MATTIAFGSSSIADVAIGYAEPTTGRREKCLPLLMWPWRAVPYMAAAAGMYAGSYVGLSAFSRYEPAYIGTNGMKWYEWLPAGFTHQCRPRIGLFYAYLPLYLTDRDLRHRDDYAGTGRYPTHVPKSLGGVERAWK